MQLGAEEGVAIWVSSILYAPCIKGVIAEIMVLLSFLFDQHIAGEL